MTRAVPLTPRLASALKQHLETVKADDLIFTSADGAPLRHRNYDRRVWRPTLARLSLSSVGIHVLRHSAAARLIAAGASPKTVQLILGHRSAAFTLTVYGHIFEADLDDLAARLDRGLEVPSAAPPRPGTVHFLKADDEK